jgi:bifunctional DNase/RNase
VFTKFGPSHYALTTKQMIMLVYTKEINTTEATYIYIYIGKNKKKNKKKKKKKKPPKLPATYDLAS